MLSPGETSPGRATPCPDWRTARHYAWLGSQPREAFAWEWLRRVEAYRRSASAALSGSGSNMTARDAALAWNLHAFADPRLTALEARPMWTRTAYPSALRAVAQAAGEASADTFTIADFAELAHVVEGRAVQHLLLANSRGSLRLDIEGARVSNGPVRLFYRLDGVRSLQRPLQTLQRFKFLLEQGRFSLRLHPPEPRARRMILVLRAFDALTGGATQRDIAEMLDGAMLDQLAWRSQFPSVRSRAQRLVNSARAFAAGAFWNLLR